MFLHLNVYAYYVWPVGHHRGHLNPNIEGSLFSRADNVCVIRAPTQCERGRESYISTWGPGKTIDNIGRNLSLINIT